MNIEELSKTTGDPTAASRGLERLIDVKPELADRLDQLRPIVALFAGSEFLTDWLITRPEQVDWLLSRSILDKPRNRADMSKNISGLMKEYDPSKALRIFKHRELCRIGARELASMAPLQETLAEWTVVAEVAIDTAVEYVETRAREKYGDPIYTELTDDEPRIASFAVLGLGKLGGSELNISSDIDIMYVHSSDNGTTSGPDQLPLHEYFVRIAREVTTLLNEQNEEGFVFRVDLDLRPEGQYGEITNSIGAMEIYYESWGRQWERQALIKARHCGGSTEVSDEIIDRLHPFVYRKYLDEKALNEIADMKTKIDKSLLTGKSVKNKGDNIKLGKGGIREIEFISQWLQMLHGGRYKNLQTQSTMKALAESEDLGYLSLPHYNDLIDSYIFFRKIENRVQYLRNQQTHSIPKDIDRQNSLAGLMGIDSSDPAKELMEQLKKRRTRIRELFDLFFFRSDEERRETFPTSLGDEETTANWLDSLKFDHPTASARALNLLRNGSSFSHPSDKSIAAFDRFGPVIVAEAIATPWPDNVILGFSNFVESGRNRNLLYDLLDENKSAIKLLAAIFSSSEHLTAILLRQPDLFDRLLGSNPVGAPADRVTYAKELRSVGPTKSHEEKITFINSFRSGESLRLGLRRILDISDRFELMEGLTILAEEYLKAVANLYLNNQSEPDDAPAEWTLIAAGKMGKREMNFGSDLDLLIFYEPKEGRDDGDALDYMNKLAQSIIKNSHTMTTYGAGYQIDMRLRPEGEGGPLVMTYNTMDDYYTNRGQAWERLALVGARAVAGDEQFGKKVLNRLSRFVTEVPLTPREIASIAGIREKIATQKVKQGAIDIKFGKGGLIEIEFICQLLAMNSAADCSVDGPFTISALENARKSKWLDTKTVVELSTAYRFYRSIEDTLRMDREQSVNTIPKDDKILLRRLARSVETKGGGGHLVDQVKQTMDMVREHYLKFIAVRKGS